MVADRAALVDTVEENTGPGIAGFAGTHRLHHSADPDETIANTE